MCMAFGVVDGRIIYQLLLFLNDYYCGSWLLWWFYFFVVVVVVVVDTIVSLI